MLKRINGIEVELKSISCGLNGEKGSSYEDSVTTNLYTCMTHECNASCPFCEYAYKDSNTFDFDKWKVAVETIMNVVPIYKASFTGGEPTIKLDDIKRCLKYLKSKDERIFTIINTNGYRLSDLAGISELDNIALSRHCITDEDNFGIFGCKVATLEDISGFKDKSKLHLSCNLIKGYVDSQESIEKYMDMASSVGVTDVGFVSLMGVNEYAREKGIDFMNIPIKTTNRFRDYQTFIREVESKCVCKCRNYMYLAGNMEIVWAYSRFYVDSSVNDAALVYMDNKLRQGFSGVVII